MSRVCVKASPAFGLQRLHTNMDYIDIGRWEGREGRRGGARGAASTRSCGSFRPRDGGRARREEEDGGGGEGEEGGQNEKEEIAGGKHER